MDDEAWAEEKERYSKALAEYEAKAAAERSQAEHAVVKALTTYRWWGITNILNEIRLWLAARRFR